LAGRAASWALPFVLEIKLVVVHKRLPGVSAAALERFAAEAARAARIRGEVDILITSSAALRRLNRQYRGKDRATDVLSFPAGNGTAGDIAISAEFGSRNARRLGHSALDELKILVLHGLLHLAGHDHERDRGEMAREESRLRRRFGLPDGLIDRTLRSRSSASRRKKNRKQRTS
jgi:probable rRNA maturation factor